MCVIALSSYSSTEDKEYRFNCAYYKAALKIVEEIGKLDTWPKSVARIDLWSPAAPVVLDLSNFYECTIHMCNDYVEYLKAQSQSEGGAGEIVTPGDEDSTGTKELDE